MIISDIHLIDFRNHRNIKISNFNKINIFTGPNGCGKTSILEAISILTQGISFRTKKNSDLVRKGSSQCYASITIIDSRYLKNKLEYSFSNFGRYRYNGKQTSFSSILGIYNSISIFPRDLDIIFGSPSIRRSFFDLYISQLDREYFLDLINYKKVLKERNNALKNNFDDRLITIYDNTLIDKGFIINYKRMQIIKELIPQLNEIYRLLTGTKDKITLMYTLKNNYFKRDNYKQKFIESMNRDRNYRTTSFGPHREDFLLTLSGRNSDRMASYGEVRMLVISLKLTQYLNIKRLCKETPILLIDDIFSVLDKKRKKNFLNYIENLDQVFIASAEAVVKKNLEYKIFFL